MAPRRHLWILAVIMAATSLVAGQPADTAGANTSQSILAPILQDAPALEVVEEGAPGGEVMAEIETEAVAEADESIESKILAPGSGEQTESRGVPRPSPAEQQQLGTRGPDDDPYQFWRTLLALALVIGLIFGARWLLRRLGAGRSTRGGGSIIEILARTAVSPRHSVLLLRVGSRLLVVGAGADGMNTLTEIDDPEQVSELLGAAERAQASSLSNTFARALGRERVDLGDTGDDPVERTAAGGAADQIKGLLSRVKRMGSRERGDS